MKWLQERLLRNLDWNLLYTFLVIVEESSITGAARKLSLSQPSVSNALKRLEGHLGVRLIERKKGSFSLTYQGLRVFEYASSAGSIVAQMAEQFSQDEWAVEGRLDIHIASHIACELFDQCLLAFHNLYPKVLINITSQPSDDILRLVLGGPLHIGISNKKIAQTGLRCDLLGYEQMAFYCGKRHSLYGVQELTLEDLRGLPYVSFESDQPGGSLEQIARLRMQNRFWGQLVAVSPNEEEVRRLIMAGIGFGALTVEGSKPHVALGNLFQLPPYNGLPVNEVYLVTPDNELLTVVESLFVDLLQQAVVKSVSEQVFRH